MPKYILYACEYALIICMHVIYMYIKNTHACNIYIYILEEKNISYSSVRSKYIDVEYIRRESVCVSV